ncbi:MAG TPA: thioredoxin family protein [Anaerolineae bacterium]|nr:thioredoxin family protein [Anaerolineae bacterium]
MRKTRSQVRQPQKAKEPRNRRWIIQLAIVAGVVLLAAIILVLKNPAADPPPVALSTPHVKAGEEGQGAIATPDEPPEKQLERLLAAGQPTLAFFHSNNCVQCIKMMEVVADVYPEFEGSVALLDVDVYDPQNRVLLLQEGIHSIPTQIFYNAAGEGKLTVGAMPAQVFRTYMRAAAGEE